MILIALVVSVLAVGLGAAVSMPGESETRTPVGDAQQTATGAIPTSVSGDTVDQSPTSTVAGADDPRATSQAEVPAGQETIPKGSLPALPEVSQPAFTLPINGLANVESVYSETHPVGNFTIRWRPGAFPPEKATAIAAVATEALATVNQKLGTDDNGHIDIFLADALFNLECIGCQGFAASDLRHVFILQDGSVGDDELPSLLTHEIGHVLVGSHIALPESLFFAEGMAVWLSDDEISGNGFISSRQSVAWALEAGVLPSIATLLEGDFAGRVRARAQYDAAASFAFFVIETYGFEAYREMYVQSAQSVELAAQVALGKDWATAETEWHNFLGQWRANVIDGVDAERFWNVGEHVMSGFRYLYLYPDQVSSDQYAALSAARLEWNRAHLDTASTLATQADLPAGVAN